MLKKHKVGCIFPMVIWSEFRMRQFRDDDPQEDALHFIIHYFGLILNILSCQVHQILDVYHRRIQIF